MDEDWSADIDAELLGSGLYAPVLISTPPADTGSPLRRVLASRHPTAEHPKLAGTPGQHGDHHASQSAPWIELAPVLRITSTTRMPPLRRLRDSYVPPSAALRPDSRLIVPADRPSLRPISRMLMPCILSPDIATRSSRLKCRYVSRLSIATPYLGGVLHLRLETARAFSG